MTYWAVLFLTYISTLVSKKSFNIFIFIILFFMAAFISPEVSHDFQNYYNGYYNSAVIFPEPLSRIIFNGAKELGLGISVSFFVFAVISISLKIKALVRLQLPVSLFLLVYFSKLFLLLDLTQVRAGIAVAFCLLAFESYIKNKKTSTILYIFLAFLFHLSSIMFLVIFAFNRNKPRLSFWLASMLLGFCISFINIKPYLFTLMIFMHAPANYLSYLSDDSEFVVNPFNALALMNAALFLAFCMYNSALKTPVINLAFKLYGVSVISFYVFIDFPVLSFRISEFFLVYQIVLLSCFYFYINASQRWIYSTIIFIYACAQLYLTYNKAAIIESYSSFLI